MPPTEEMSENEKLAWSVLESTIQTEEGKTPKPEDVFRFTAAHFVQLICKTLEKEAATIKELRTEIALAEQIMKDDAAAIEQLKQTIDDLNKKVESLEADLKASDEMANNVDKQFEGINKALADAGVKVPDCENAYGIAIQWLQAHREKLQKVVQADRLINEYRGKGTFEILMNRPQRDWDVKARDMEMEKARASADLVRFEAGQTTEVTFTQRMVADLELSLRNLINDWERVQGRPIPVDHEAIAALAALPKPRSSNDGNPQDR